MDIAAGSRIVKGFEAVSQERDIVVSVIVITLPFVVAVEDVEFFGGRLPVFKRVGLPLLASTLH